MAKIKFVSGVLLSAILISTSATSAQAISVGEIKAKFQNKIEVRQENREDWQETTNERKTERVEVRVTGKAENQELRISAKAESAQERLNKMVARITLRLENHDKLLTNWLARAKARNEVRKSKERAIKAAEVDTLLVTATTSLAAASASKNTAIGLLNGLTVENWKAQDVTAKTAKTAVVTAQQNYAKVIKDFKLALEALKKSVN